MKTKACIATDVIREIERRTLNYFMDFCSIVKLKELSDDVSGYDVIKYLQLKYHFLPSSGTVYSCLYNLERKGMLKGRQNGRKRLYALTQYGAETAQSIIEGKDRIINFVSMILQKNGSLTFRNFPQSLFHT